MTNTSFKAGLTERSTALVKKAQEEVEKHKVALAEALEKANANAPPSSDSVDMKRHIAELKAQEEKLKTEHEAEFKSRVDSAVQEALKDRPAPPSDGTFTSEQQAAVDTAIETYKEELKKDIEAAVERGRKEVEMRVKLKDSQLTRAQNRVKELEMQVNDWVTKGLVILPVKQPVPPAAAASTPPTTSDPSASATTHAATASTAKSANAGLARPAAAPAKPAAPAAAVPQAGGTQARPNPATAATTAVAAPSNTVLPRRPPTGTAPARGGAPVRGRGGAVRGGALRQMPQKPTGQQAAPAAASPTVASTAPSAAPPTAGGVSIIGAASKRPHDDAATGENSLAKRMKPNGAP